MSYQKEIDELNKSLEILSAGTSQTADEAAVLAHDYRAFCKAAWTVIEPSTPLLWSWHLDAISDHLEAVRVGHIKRLLINIGPGYGKSNFLSVLWQPWYWINHPESRWIVASHTQDLSTGFNVKARTIIESDWYQIRWGTRFKITSDENTKKKFVNNKTGMRQAVSVGGKITGLHGGNLLIDDALNAEHKPKEEQLKKVNGWFDGTFSTRISNPEKDSIVVVGQQLDRNDLSNHLIKKGGWTHLCLPTEYVPDRRCVTILGTGRWSDPRSTAGELLAPAQVSAAKVAEIKVDMGSHKYSAQHQQNPAPPGSSMFEKTAFKYYDTEGDGRTFRLYHRTNGTNWTVNLDDCEIFAVADPAGTDASDNLRACYTAIGAFALCPAGDLILLDMYRRQVDVIKGAEDITNFSSHHEVDFVGIEKDGIGLAVVKLVKANNVRVVAIKAIGSKEQRAEMAQSRMEAGMIHLPRRAAWLNDFEAELIGFPGGTYKDMVDVLSHAASIAFKRRGHPRIGDGYNPKEYVAKIRPEPEEEVTTPGQQITASTAEVDDAEALEWLAGAA